MEKKELGAQTGDNKPAGTGKKKLAIIFAASFATVLVGSIAYDVASETDAFKSFVSAKTEATGQKPGAIAPK